MFTEVFSLFTTTILSVFLDHSQLYFLRQDCLFVCLFCSPGWPRIHLLLCWEHRHVPLTTQPETGLFFESGSLTSLELSRQARLADQAAPGIPLSLLPQCCDYKHMPPCLAFSYRFRTLCLQQSSLTAAAQSRSSFHVWSHFRIIHCDSWYLGQY